MIQYELPKLKVLKLKSGQKNLLNIVKGNLLMSLILVIVLSSVFGFMSGLISGSYFYNKITDKLEEIGLASDQSVNQEDYFASELQEKAVIKAVDMVSPAVVSIIITKDLPIIEQYYYNPFGEVFDFGIPQYRQSGTEKKEVGGGTGFIVSEDGMVLTNKHVVIDNEADYTVLTADGKRFSAKVLARDPIQDLALIKIIDQEENKSFPSVELGDSDNVKIGQTAIAIGNVLGRYQNTVSVGIVSGLGRTISASGGGFYEILEDVIQTDTAINKGNSGGPLLNLRGQVIGINTAIDLEGQNIGFSIPINKAKRDIEQVKEVGKIVYPFLGVRYVIIDEQVKADNDLSVNYGALIVKGDGEPAISPGSAADKAGLKEGDIILEFNGEKITVDNSLAKIIEKYEPQDKILLKILRSKQEIDKNVVLGERSE
jgi:serine protease Do